MRGRKIFTCAVVDAEVARIRTMARDYEAAHSAEDDLYTKVLEEIAKGKNTDRATRLAKSALKTKKIMFSRYTA